MADRPSSDPDNQQTPTDLTANALPKENWQQFIDLAYRSTLNRPADAPGMEHYLLLLENGTPAVDILVEMTSSDEYQRIHRGYLHRLDPELEPYFSTPVQELSTELQQHHLITKQDFDSAWQGHIEKQTPDATVHYSKQRARSHQVFNDIKRLCQGITTPRILEYGGSGLSNLYSALIPEAELFFSDVSSLNNIATADSEQYDLIVLNHIISGLTIDTDELFTSLLSRLSNGGLLYLSTINIYSRAGLAAIERRDNPQLPGVHDYSLKELLKAIEGAGGECKASYFISYEEEDKQLSESALPEDQRQELVLVAQRGYPPLRDIADEDREIVIHIGSDKAGSTAIQSHIFGNREWLRQRGVYIPETFLGPNNGHEQLLREPSDDKLITLKNEIAEKAGKHRKIFLSWEGTHFSSKAKIKLLAKYFGSYNVRILFYIREQADIIQSGLLQQIKSEPAMIDLKKVARHPGTPGNRNYYKTVKRWEQCFDKFTPNVIYFDRKEFPKGDVVRDVLNRLGCAEHTGFSFFQADINISLDVPSALAMNQRDEEGTQTRKQRLFYADLLLQHIRQHGAQTKYFLTKEQVQKIRAHYLQSNQNLITEYQVSNQLTDNQSTLDTGIEPNFSADIDKRVAKLRKAVDKLDEFPVCFGAEVRNQELAKHLYAGWHVNCHGGFWSRGKTSTLRMRPLMQGIQPFHFSISIIITGRYHWDEDPMTNVSINGLGYDNVNLSDSIFTLPLDSLLDSSEIEILLEHPRRKTADGLKDTGFFIESLQLRLNKSL